MVHSKLRGLARAALIGASCLASAAYSAEVTGLNGNSLITVDTSAPSTVLRTTAITGLGSGQTIVALDGRPASGGRVLYGVSNVGQLYAINPRTGVASAVGTPIALQGTAFGFDFNPTVDRIRLISNTGQNLRINPDTGAVTVDGNLNIMVGGQPIVVSGNTAAAYTNNFAGATSTTLFVINAQTGLLQIQNPPNAGTLQTVGGLGGPAAGVVSGFDISIIGDAIVSVVQNNMTNLYSVNLTTGAATFIGRFATGTPQGLAFLPSAFADQAGLTPNQAAVGGAFDNFTSIAPGFVPLLTTLDRLPDAAARADALGQLSPVPFGILPEVVLETNELVDGTIRTYLRDSRMGGTPGGGAMIDAERGIGGFLVGSGRTGSFEARGDRGQVDYGSAGFMGGLSVRMAGGSMFGVAGGYDNADFRLNPITSNSSADTWFVGAFGSLAAGPVFVDVVGSYGKSDFELSRNVAFSNFSNNSSAEADARYYSVSATAGLSMDMGGLEMEPYAGVRFADVKIDAFSEGAGLTNLNVGQQDVESLQGVAGLRLGGNFESGTARIRPSVRAEYRREFRNDEGRALIANFNGAGINAPFTTTTSAMGDDHVVVGADLTIAGDAPVGMVAGYTGHLKGGYDIHSVQVGLRFRF
jgi:uncharacterized protein with beta-barrel porin domain